MNDLNTTTATNAAATSTAPAIALIPHTSDMLLTTAIRDALGGFRIVTETPAIFMGQIAQKIANTKAEESVRSAALNALASLPLVIASRGAFSIVDLVEGRVELPAPGDIGFTLSLVGFKGLDLGGGEKKNGIWALAIYPAHSVTAAMESEEGRNWLQTQMDKELGLVAFRGIRVTMGETTISDLTEAAMSMPCVLSDYTDRARATGEAFGTFNDLWPGFRAAMGQNPANAKLLAVLPTKRADMLAAIRSKVFAEVKFPGLEKSGVFARIGEAFATFVDRMAANAEREGAAFTYAAADVTRWLEGRETLDLVRAQVETVDQDDLEAALAAFGTA